MVDLTPSKKYCRKCKRIFNTKSGLCFYDDTVLKQFKGHQKVCCYCKKTFQTKMLNQRYCSSSCRVKHCIEKQRGKIKKDKGYFYIPSTSY